MKLSRKMIKIITEIQLSALGSRLSASRGTSFQGNQGDHAIAILQIAG
jgi:hypothetical protein